MEAKRFFKPKGVLSKTRAQISALKNSGKLIPGQEYLIADPEESILLFAATTNSFANSATLLAKNPDYKKVGDYSGVADFTGIDVANLKGIWQSVKVEIEFTLDYGIFYVGNEVNAEFWSATISVSGSTMILDGINGNTIQVGDTFVNVLESSKGTVTSVNYIFSINQGDIVLWDGLHWQKKTTVTVPENPSDDNEANYFKLPKNISLAGYISENNSIEYYTSDASDSNWRITARKNNGSTIHNGTYGENNTNNFQWGNPDVHSIRCDSGCTINILNNSGQISNVDLRTGALFFASRNSGTINTISISQGGNLDADLNAGSIHALEISKAFVQADMLKDFKVDSVRILGETNIGLFNCENYVENFYIAGVGSNFNQNLEAVFYDPQYMLEVPPNENYKHYAGNFYVSGPTSAASFNVVYPNNPSLGMNYRYYPSPGFELTFDIVSPDATVPRVLAGNVPAVLSGDNGDYIEFSNKLMTDPGNPDFITPITKQVGGEKY